jgi:pimeloyl-ACP methyl ester carboxylesterase
MPVFPAPRRIEVSPRDAVETITLSVHEIAPESPVADTAVIFCHGFPDLAFGWRNQLSAIADAGFHAIAPDQRGYGASSAPAAVEAYGIANLTGDLVGLLDALEIERAVFVGHDWGGFVAWAMPVLHPDRVIGVAGLCTPYMPFPSVEKHLAVVAGEAERQYVAWFQQAGAAEVEMDSKVRPILTRILRTAVPLEETIRFALSDGKLNMNPFKDAERWPILGERLGSERDLDVYCDAYEKAGFRGGINWYRNIDRNAAEHPGIGIQPLDIPCLMMTAEWDPGMRPEFTDKMTAVCPDLELHNLKQVGHWIQQEARETVNELLIAWLNQVRDRERAAGR